MTKDDPVLRQLDLLAQLLEAHGYALEVDYAGATITVWTEAWPILVRVERGNPGGIQVKREDE